MAAEEATPELRPSAPPPPRLKDALRKARVDSAERTGVIVDLRDAELARLELLSEALDPVFAEIPPEVELFERGISRGDTPRLWIDAVAHVVLDRDRRAYRFVQDTRYGRKVLSESADIAETARAITRYVAARLIERERALAEGSEQRAKPRQSAGRAIGAFVLGLIIGAAALVIAALISSGQ